MKATCTLATRESIRAFYADGTLLIVATGSVSAGNRIDINMLKPPGTPLEFTLDQCPKPGVWPAVMVSYTYSESFRITKDPERVRLAGTIKVHHAEGVDEVPLNDAAQELPAFVATLSGGGAQEATEGAHEATGESRNLSFDEAFADAMKNLPPPDQTHPDQLTRVKVEEVGGLFGGFAGFHHLYVRISAVRD